MMMIPIISLSKVGLKISMILKELLCKILFKMTVTRINLDLVIPVITMVTKAIRYEFHFLWKFSLGWGWRRR